MQYYRKSDAAIICYAVDKRTTFDECTKWNKQLQKNVDAKANQWMKDLVVAVAANKVDLPDEDHEVDREEVE